ncbi:MAG: hypothetical protein [Circoviridae sp.]|nr:MAG: hypothetical protein [Circoviridae sp.]
MFRRRLSYRRSSVRRRSLKQQGVTTFSARKASATIQPRLRRGPMLQRVKFLTIEGDGMGTPSRFQPGVMVASRNNHSINTSFQGQYNMHFLNPIDPGNANSERLGLRTMMASIVIRGSFYYSPFRIGTPPIEHVMGDYTIDSGGAPINMNPSIFDRSMTCMLCYYPRTKFGAIGLPDLGALLEAPVSTFSPQNEVNEQGVKIIFRKNFRLTLEAISAVPVAGVEDGYRPITGIGRGSRRDVNWKINLGLPVEYISMTGGTGVSDVRSGHLFLICLANVSSASALPASSNNTAAFPKFSYRARLAFADA